MTSKRIGRRTFAVHVALAVLCAGRVASPAERLVLMGGGPRPEAALARFVEWSGGSRGRVLIVPWASSEPAESGASFREDLEPHHPGHVDIAPLAPLDEEKRKALLAALAEAGGVFFTGGDQGRIMDVLRDEELLRAFRDRYRAGVVFGGTSAGTAIMSPRMITGEGDFTVIDSAQVEIRPGLGLLEGTVVDQHFVKRQRENRLFGLILAHPELLGVGIDEGTSLVVRDGRFGEVLGSTQVMLVDGSKEKGALVVRMARPGQTVDLRERRVR